MKVEIVRRKFFSRGALKRALVSNQSGHLSSRGHHPDCPRETVGVKVEKWSSLLSKLFDKNAGEGGIG